MCSSDPLTALLEAYVGCGGYECDTTKYVPGTAERLADTYVEMLTEQFNNK